MFRWHGGLVEVRTLAFDVEGRRLPADTAPKEFDLVVFPPEKPTAAYYGDFGA